MRIALPSTISGEAFARRDPFAPIVPLDGETMGTTWRILLVPPADADLAALRIAIVARLEVLVAEMSHWRADSVLARFNHAPAGHWATLPADFAQVIGAALTIAEASGGSFDPAVGRLVDLWGFGPGGATEPPDDRAVEGARRSSGWRRLAFDAPSRRLRQPGALALDLSGIAKGYAVDALADLLAAAGVHDCLVEIGGELVGRGVRPDGEPWWVDLETPPETTLEPLRIALHGLAVATSGDYRRGHHTLDPRTGRPARNGVVSASVVHASAMEADGWATALTVLGPVDGLALAATLGIAGRIVTQIAGETREYLTPRLIAMLDD